MLESPHVFVGAAIARSIPNPLISLPLAFASHFVLDMLPHWNPHINTEIKKYGHPTKTSKNLILADSMFALVSGSLIALGGNNASHTIAIFAACFLSVLPDVVEIPYYFFGKKTKWVEAWIKWQKSIQNDVPMMPGLFSQLVIISVSILWIIT